jgi:hypothetical protein
MVTQKAHTGSSDNIFVIDNFMDKEDVEEVHRLCKLSFDEPNLHQWWYNKYPCPEYIEYTSGAYRDACLDGMDDYHRNKSPILKKYLDKAVEFISFTTGKKIIPIFHFNKHESITGVVNPPHCDSESLHMGIANYLPDYSPFHVYEPAIMEYTCNLYINNDYGGGSLYFPEYDIEVEHKPGQLILFPSTLEYIHGVHEVTNGIRWNLLSQLVRPKLILMHNTIFNMWHILTDEQKKVFPELLRDVEYPPDTRGCNL